MAPAEPPDGPATDLRGRYPSAMHAKNIPPMSDQAMTESHADDPRIDPAPSPVPVAATTADSGILVPASLLVQSRRGFLRGALAVAGGTAAAAALAACSPAAGSAWSYAPLRSLTAATGTETEGQATASPAAAGSTAPITEPVAGRTHPAWLDRTRHGCPREGPTLRRQPGWPAGPGGLHRRAGTGPRVHDGRRTATSRSSRPSTAT